MSDPITNAFIAIADGLANKSRIAELEKENAELREKASESKRVAAYWQTRFESLHSFCEHYADGHSDAASPSDFTDALEGRWP